MPLFGLLLHSLSLIQLKKKYHLFSYQHRVVQTRKCTTAKEQREVEACMLSAQKQLLVTAIHAETTAHKQKIILMMHSLLVWSSAMQSN